MADFVTQDELKAALGEERARSDALLDEAISRVEGDIRDTENRMLERQDALQDRMTKSLRYEVGKIDAHLDRQDAYIMRKRFEWKTWRRDLAMAFLATLLAAVVAHFGFGIG